MKNVTVWSSYMCGRQHHGCQGMTVQLLAGKRSSISEADFYSLVGSLLNAWDIFLEATDSLGICWFILAAPTLKMSPPQISVSRQALNRSADTSSENSALKFLGKVMGYKSSALLVSFWREGNKPVTQNVLEGLFCPSVHLWQKRNKAVSVHNWLLQIWELGQNQS